MVYIIYIVITKVYVYNNTITDRHYSVMTIITCVSCYVELGIHVQSLS